MFNIYRRDMETIIGIYAKININIINHPEKTMQKIKNKRKHKKKTIEKNNKRKTNKKTIKSIEKINKKNQ